MPQNIYSRLVYGRRLPLLGRLCYILLKALGSEIPRTVIHPNCEIGNNVTIYQGVTIGRGDVHRSPEQSRFKGIKLEDNVIVGAGAKILCTIDVLQVRAGTIVGANAVLLQSTNPGEIWAGIPARCIGSRGEPLSP